MKSKDALKTLRRLGWFVGLGAEAEKRAAERIVAREDFDLESLATVLLDVDGCESSEDYAAAIRSISRQVSDTFVLEPIATMRQGATVSASFQVDSRRFNCSFVVNDDWLSMDLIENINEALGSVGHSVRLRALPVEDCVAHLAVVSDAALERAQEAGLVPTGFLEGAD